MKRACSLVLLVIACIPVAFFMRAWLDIDGLKPTESFATLQSLFLCVQMGSFFIGSILQF